MDIGEAVKHMREGGKVARQGWNGKNMFLLYSAGGTFNAVDLEVGPLVPFVVMKTADDRFVPWLCSQTDLLATDWEAVVAI